jgi:rhodanese-related sulfurtransferase
MKMPSLWWLPFGRSPEISPQELHHWLEEGQPVQLADARTSLEYQQGTIGAARHAPLSEMPRSLDRLGLDPAVPIVMLCLSGHRSIPGTRWLRSHGYQAYSLKGGILAWKRAGFPLTPPGE